MYFNKNLIAVSTVEQIEKMFRSRKLVIILLQEKAHPTRLLFCDPSVKLVYIRFALQLGRGPLMKFELSIGEVKMDLLNDFKFKFPIGKFFHQRNRIMIIGYDVFMSKEELSLLIRCRES